MSYKANRASNQPSAAPQCPGALVISLDFELHWGIRDHVSIDAYRDNLQGTRTAIDEMLRLFTYYEVHATWATVGFLMCDDAKDARRMMPTHLPGYCDPRLDPYPELDRLMDGAGEDSFYFAPREVQRIASTPNMEIATHTFSHFYTCAPGANIDSFRADLEAALRVAERYGRELRSIVFPRNQYTETVLAACREMGIRAYRANEPYEIYDFTSPKSQSLPYRLGRLVDSYAPLRPTSLSAASHDPAELVPVPASRFLRPSNEGARGRLRGAAHLLKVRRILAGLREAARTGTVFHLWWHPHNFGADIETNVQVLDQILMHYRSMKALYGMRSCAMGELNPS